MKYYYWNWALVHLIFAEELQHFKWRVPGRIATAAHQAKLDRIRSQ